MKYSAKHKFMFLILITAIFFIIGCNPQKKQQEQLAQELGVEIDDYSYEKVFPLGYFNSILKEGMSMDEVHSIVKGYEKVLQCGSRCEVYYFFDNRDTKALRFMIFYDKQSNFERIQGEDTDSGTIWTDGCIEGTLYPNNKDME